jgi:hypothetical protein
LFLDDEMVGVRESIRAEDDTTDAELDIESQEIVTSRDSHAVVIAAVHLMLLSNCGMRHQMDEVHA